MFFRNQPKAHLCGLNYGLGVQSFANSLIMISMYRYDAGLINLITAIEAFTSDETTIDGDADQRTILKKIKKLEKKHPQFKADFQRRAENKSEPITLIYEAYQLRNRLIHSGHSIAMNSDSARAMLTTVLPLAQTIYRAVFDGELYDHLAAKIGQSLFLSHYLSSTATFNEDGWDIRMLPVAWTVQNYIKPNFEPRYLVNSEGFYINQDETVWNAVSSLKKTGKYDDETLFCPICDNQSIAVEFDFDSHTPPYGLHLARVTCVCCRLDLGPSKDEKLLSAALFDDFITENEPRLVKEFGLT